MGQWVCLEKQADTARFDPSLDNEVREFARGLLKKASQSAGVVQDEKIRATEGVGQYGNYASEFSPFACD